MAKKPSKLRPKYCYRAVFNKNQLGFELPDDEGKGFGHTLALHKTKWSGSPYSVPNEFICAEIGHFLRLPIPPSGITYGQGDLLCFSSLDFNFDTLQLPPVVPDLCWKALPELSTGVVLFDILIANSDRWEKNLVVDNVAKPTAMRVFDHDQAFFGGVFEPTGEKRLAQLTTRLGITAGPVSNGNPHCLLDQIDTDKHFDERYERIDTIPKWLIPEICAEARNYGLTKSEAIAAKNFGVLPEN